VRLGWVMRTVPRAGHDHREMAQAAATILLDPNAFACCGASAVDAMAGERAETGMATSAGHVVLAGKEPAREAGSCDGSWN
jgi:hypothetical protein